MTDLGTPDYFRRRERQARELADQARLPEIEQIHRDMAAQYSRLALKAATESVRTTLRIVTA